MEFQEYQRKDCFKDWRFSGRCMDVKSGKIYMFKTNSIYEINQFKSKKVWLGMKFIDGQYNENYEVVRKLRG